MTFDEVWKKESVIVYDNPNPLLALVDREGTQNILKAFALELQKRIEANGCGMAKDSNGNLPCPFCGNMPVESPIYPGEIGCTYPDCHFGGWVPKDQWNNRHVCGSPIADGTAPSCLNVLHNLTKEWCK